MDLSPVSSAPRLEQVLRAAAERMQHVSDADIVSLYLFDAESRTYYAPVAVGIPDEDLAGSLEDMADQLARYLDDVARGKAPAELHVKNYGPNVWLTVTRQRLVTKDAEREIDSSFIRRHHIQSVVGLPLTSDGDLAGLLYLDFEGGVGDERRGHRFVPERLSVIEREAAQVAVVVNRAREAEERSAFSAVGVLADQLAVSESSSGGFTRRLEAALSQLSAATGFDAMAVYRHEGDEGRLGLLSASRGVDVPPTLLIPADLLAADSNGASANAETLLTDAFAASGLFPVARFPLSTGAGRLGYLLALSRDRLGIRRKAPGVAQALRLAAGQIALVARVARMDEEIARYADQLALTVEIGQAIASSIDLDQTLRVVTKGLARLIGASLCQVALFEEDGSAWYGAAASDDEESWRRMHGERPETSFLFDVLDRRAPLVVEDVRAGDLVKPFYARHFGIRSLLALPLVVDDQPIGAVVLAQRDRLRSFSADEVQRASALAQQAAVAIKSARLHAFAEEEHHIQKDVILVGFGQWGQKAYRHLLTLKQFYNFKTHVVVPDRDEAGRAAIADAVRDVLANGDAFYWDSPANPARDQLQRRLESSCYVVTYIVTPAATHLAVTAEYYDLSNVIVIEKPLGAAPEAYRAFLDRVDGSVEIVAADHYYFKIEVRLLQLLLTEERTLKTFLDSVEEIEIELLEARPLDGAAAEIGVIADLIPHAFAIVSLFTPIERIRLADDLDPLVIGRQEPPHGEKETYARLSATFPHQGRMVRLVIIAGKGIEDSKWIKLSGERRSGGRRAFYKFDFIKGEAIDGTQTNLRAAVRHIREAGVPDTAHLAMLRHVIEKRHPAVGILAIREAIRSNQRIGDLVAMASEHLARGRWLTYVQGQRPNPAPLHELQAVVDLANSSSSVVDVAGGHKP